MKVHGDTKPETLTVEELPSKPGYALARFTEHAEPYEEDGYSGLVYDEYTLELLYYPSLQRDIEADLERWFQMARTEDEARRPVDEKLAERDKLIAALTEQNQMLTECVLEMSEIIYG